LALKEEVKQVKKLFGELTFDTFYLGGGTPSLLTSTEIKEIILFLREEFDFQDNFEFSIEVNPEDVTREKVLMYHQLGVNRVSVGSQSFNNDLLRQMGRLHTPDQIKSAVQLFQQTGIDNISSDLIIKLPKQTLEDVRCSLESLNQLNVSQVSVYDLDVHPYTVFGVMKRKGTLELPNEDLHFEMARLVEDFLMSNGYHRYEIMNFAKPGYESKHNLIYWNNQEYIGLGPGAYSYKNGLRYQFSKTVNQYLDKCLNHHWDNEVEDKISSERKEYENLMTGLRLSQGVQIEQFKEIKDKLTEKIKILVDNDFLKLENNRISLTQKGRFIFESLFVDLLD